LNFVEVGGFLSYKIIYSRRSPVISPGSNLVQQPHSLDLISSRHAVAGAFSADAGEALFFYLESS